MRIQLALIQNSLRVHYRTASSGKKAMGRSVNQIKLRKFSIDDQGEDDLVSLKTNTR